MKKLIGIFVCMLLIGTAVLSVSGTVIVERTPISTSLGDTLYVGGSGPSNYSTIQEAINDASDGDTVFVYDDSSPYVENLIVDKSISLIGEDKQSTIIDGSFKYTVVRITADNVTITGFTIQNCGSIWGDADIEILYSDYNTISSNIIQNNHKPWSSDDSGIMLFSSDYNTIAGNIIAGSYRHGLFLENCYYNNITGNHIVNNTWGMIIGSDNALFFNLMGRIQKNKVSYNNFQGNVISFQLESWRNELICNNFIGNITGKALWGPNKYDRNYWNRPRIFPKMILSPYILPTFQFDLHPAQEPYDIS